MDTNTCTCTGTTASCSLETQGDVCLAGPCLITLVTYLLLSTVSRSIKFNCLLVHTYNTHHSHATHTPTHTYNIHIHKYTPYMRYTHPRMHHTTNTYTTYTFTNTHHHALLTDIPHTHTHIHKHTPYII